MKYVNNTEEVKQTIKEKIKESLNLIGIHGVTAIVDEITRINKSTKTIDKQGKVKGRLIDTGLMKNSNAHEVKGDTVEIGNTVKYSVYQELGTSKIQATPFLKPAILNSKQKFIKIIKLVFKGVFE